MLLKSWVWLIGRASHYATVFFNPWGGIRMSQLDMTATGKPYAYAFKSLEPNQYKAYEVSFYLTYFVSDLLLPVWQWA
jgi:hypothetical protein